MTHPALSVGLRMAPLFAVMDHDDVATLATSCSLRHATRGDVLYRIGETVTHLPVVMGGWIKLSRSTLDGAEAVLDVAGAGRVVGLQDMFGAGVYSLDATVVEKGDVLMVPVQALRSLLDRKPRLALEFLRELASDHLWLEHELEHRTLQKAPQRLGCFLLRLVPDMNRSASGQVSIHLPFDKTLLAARLGMQPETFSRALAALRKDVGLTVHGATLVVPGISALSNYTCGACSGGYPCQHAI